MEKYLADTIRLLREFQEEVNGGCDLFDLHRDGKKIEFIDQRLESLIFIAMDLHQISAPKIDADWRSVDDELPEMYVQVLVYVMPDKSNKWWYWGASRYSIGWRMPENGEIKWFFAPPYSDCTIDHIDEFHYDEYMHKVVYWMPLPHKPTDL